MRKAPYIPLLRTGHRQDGVPEGATGGNPLPAGWQGVATAAPCRETTAPPEPGSASKRADGGENLDLRCPHSGLWRRGQARPDFLLNALLGVLLVTLQQRQPLTSDSLLGQVRCPGPPSWSAPLRCSSPVSHCPNATPECCCAGCDKSFKLRVPPLQTPP